MANSHLEQIEVAIASTGPIDHGDNLNSFLELILHIENPESVKCINDLGSPARKGGLALEGNWRKLVPAPCMLLVSLPAFCKGLLDGCFPGSGLAVLGVTVGAVFLNGWQQLEGSVREGFDILGGVE